MASSHLENQPRPALAEPLKEHMITESASTSVEAALLALGQDCASRLAAPWRDLDHGALLYDDKGLPR